MGKGNLLPGKEELGPQQVANSRASTGAGCSVPGAMHKVPMAMSPK